LANGVLLSIFPRKIWREKVGRKMFELKWSKLDQTGLGLHLSQEISMLAKIVFKETLGSGRKK